MAKADFTSANDNSSDTAFRAWALAIHTAIVALGWVDQNATGQINFTTVTRPAANTEGGFKVYAMGDSLQGTAPCFLRMGFGSSSSQSNPKVWAQIGTTHNGSGTLGGNTTTNFGMNSSTASTSATLQSYASGSTSSLRLCLWASVAAYSFPIIIERTKDVNGADTNEGVTLIAYSNSTGLIQQTIGESVGANGVSQGSVNSPIPMGGTSILGAGIGFYPIFPFIGRNFPAMLGAFLYVTNDNGAQNSTVVMTVYGASHTYLLIGNSAAALSNLRSSGVGTAILYE